MLRMAQFKIPENEQIGTAVTKSIGKMSLVEVIGMFCTLCVGHCFIQGGEVEVLSSLKAATMEEPVPSKC